MAAGSGMSGRVVIAFPRHGRIYSGHPRLLMRRDCKDVDGRDKPGHDGNPNSRRPGQAKREPGPITTIVYVARSCGRGLIPQLTSVVMGHGVRRDDDNQISYTFAAVFGQYLSRRCRFTSFPVGVRGSSASKSILLGHLIGDRCFRQNTISSASSSFPAFDMSCGCTTALTSSPISSFGTPNTATSATPGWVISTSSVSCG